jgi:pSer/pThr/pTyr-binding forkhead associated (FHA) protein
MQKLLIRHLGSERGDRVEEFREGFGSEIILGRDASAQVRFDPDSDDLVSRQHTKIIRDPSDPDCFQLLDLQSRNGTFLNRQRIYSAVRLNHNDVIQLGAGGPEVRFEMDPPPRQAMAASSPFDISGISVKPTRESWMPDPLGAPRPVGRHTIERMLGEVFTRNKKDVSRSMWMGIIAFAMIVFVGLGAWVYLRRSHITLQSGLESAQQQNKESIAEVKEELKKQPAVAEEAKQEVQRLESELEKSNKRAEENHQATLKALEAQRRQAAELARIIRQQQQQQQAQAQSASQPSAAPTRVQDSPETAKPVSFDALLNEALSAMENAKFGEAQANALKLIRLDPARWEGYAFAAQAAAKLSDLKLANEMYQKAISRAPGEAKANLESQMKQLQESSQK